MQQLNRQKIKKQDKIKLKGIFLVLLLLFHTYSYHVLGQL